MNETTTNPKYTNPEEFRTRFAIYHPNAKGTGCALKMELHPAHGNHDGCIMMCLARQKSVGDFRGTVRKFATFDWDNRICVKLDFSDICKMLQVMRGECESLEDGKGLYHRTDKYSTRIVFRHLIEPINGYSLEIYRDTIGKPDETSSAHIILNGWEALGIDMSMENSIGLICFGIPKVMAREAGFDNAAEEDARALAEA